MCVRPGVRIGVVLFVGACAGQQLPEPEALVAYRQALAPLLAKRKKARDDYEAKRDTPGIEKGELSKSAEAAVLAMQRYHNKALDQVGSYDEGSDERRWCVQEVLAGLKSDRDYYDGLDYSGVVIWLEYSIGRAYVLAGDVDRACREGFNPVCDFDSTKLSVKAKQWTDSLKLFAFYMRAKSLFDAKRYEEAIEAVDAMFRPPLGYPQALDDPKGNAAVLIKAKALYLRKPPDFEGAVRECERVMDRKLMPWPNNAGRLLPSIHRQMQEFPGAKGHWSPGTIRQRAIAGYHIAAAERDPGKQMELLGKAVKDFRDAIAACRREDVPYTTRLEHGPAAWFELGICYSKMKLWDEACLAFEKVGREFAKDTVGMELAKLPESRGLLRRVRADIKAGKHKPEEGAGTDEYALLFDEAKLLPELKPLLEGLETRLRKSANNVVVAARRRHKETRSAQDAGRLEEAIKALVAVDPEKQKSVAFHNGLLRRHEAARELKAGRPENAVSKWEEAGRLFLESAEAQSSVSELACYLAGDVRYRAMVEAMKLAQGDPKYSAEARTLARKALAAYEKFIEKANSSPAGTGSGAAKRKERLETTARAREHIEKAYGPAP